MSGLSRDRTAAETFAAHGDAVRDSIWKIRPAVVTAVTGQTVSVQCTVKTPLWPEGIDPDAEAPVIFEDGKIWQDVPWMTLRAGGFAIWIPPSVGDTCLLLFSDLSCDTWRDGDGSHPAPPGFIGKHSADSPFALPMIAPDSKALATAPPGTLVIGKDGAAEQIQVTGSNIQLGATGVDFVALASKVLTQLGNIVTAFNAHTHPATLAVSGASATGVTSVPTSPMSSPASVASSLVKCD